MYRYKTKAKGKRGRNTKIKKKRCIPTKFNTEKKRSQKERKMHHRNHENKYKYAGPTN